MQRSFRCAYIDIHPNKASLLNEEDDFAYRYLLTLTTWSAAIDHLCQKRVLCRLQNCTATMVVVRDHRAASFSDGQYLLDAVEQDARLAGEHMTKCRAEAKEVLRGRIQRARTQTRKYHVDAEAGLIALGMHLRKTENTDTARRVADVFVSATLHHQPRSSHLYVRLLGAAERIAHQNLEEVFVGHVIGCLNYSSNVQTFTAVRAHLSGIVRHAPSHMDP